MFHEWQWVKSDVTRINIGKIGSCDKPPHQQLSKFIRVASPVSKWDEVVEGPKYKIIDGICYDVWAVNKISDEKRYGNKIIQSS